MVRRANGNQKTVPKLKLNLVCRLVKVLRKFVIDEPADDAVADAELPGTAPAVVVLDAEQEFEFSEDLLDDLMEFALNSKMDNVLPSEHHGARYENPLLCALVARAEAMGNRIQGLTVKNIQEKEFCYFFYDAVADAQEVLTFSEKSLKLALTVDQIKAMPDLKLVDNHSMSASLVSEASGYCQNLHGLLKHQAKFAWPNPTEAFECVDATKQFEGLAPRTPACKAEPPRAKAKSLAAVGENHTVPKVARPKKMVTAPRT